MADTADIDGIEVSGFASMDEAVAHLVASNGVITPGFGVAINPEKIMRARHDAHLRAVLAKATLRYPDGIGVVRTMRRKGVATVRIAGTDLWLALMQRAAATSAPIYLLGAAPNVVRTVATSLTTDLGANVVGYCSGFYDDEAAVIEGIVASKPAIVCVAMGSPRQEKFILKCRELWPGAFYMGVGGTFDVNAGTVTRAPVVWQRAGLEWLYRLLRQPSRLMRQAPLFRYAILHALNRL